MPVSQDKPVPYAPASAMLDVIARRRHRGLPVPITFDVLGRAGVSQSLIPRTFQSLQLLDLIDGEGNPTPTFEAIRTAAEADYQKVLADWLHEAYAEVFAFVDPKTDDDVRIRDAFRSYNPPGQQDRMVTLFTGLCTAAGLMPEKPAQAQRARANVSSGSRVTATATVKRAPTPAKVVLPHHPIALKTSTSLPPAIAGLIETLPDPAEGWSKDRRDSFVRTFEAVLDFSIPVLTREGPSDDAE